MDGINGLILPGGAFDSPNEFYTDPLKPNGSRPGTRSHAYISSIMKAEKNGLPILGNLRRRPAFGKHARHAYVPQR